MQIGELFVKIAIKGAETAQKSLNLVKRGLGSIASSSLEAKAAVIALVYGLERMVATSAAQGTEMKLFGDYTGMSLDKLQRWQYLARESGVSAEEMTGSLKGLHAVMGRMATNEGAPGGMQAISTIVGGFDESKLNNMDYMMGKLRQFAVIADQMKIPEGMANNLLSTFGLSENIISAFRKSHVDLEKISKGEIFSDTEIKNLNRMNVELNKFWRSLEMFKTRLVHDYGSKIIKGLQTGLRFTKEFHQNLTKLLKDFPLLQKAIVLIGALLALYFAPFTTIVTGILLLLNEIEKKRKGKESLLDWVPGMMTKKTKKEAGEWFENIVSSVGKLVPENIFQKSGLSAVGAGSSNSSINQTNNFHVHGDLKDHRIVTDPLNRQLKNIQTTSGAKVQFK